MDFELKVISFETEEKIKFSQSFSFTSKLNSHLEKYRKNADANKLSLVSLSFLFSDEKNSAIYSGDVGATQDLYLFDDIVDWFITEVSHIDLKELSTILYKNHPDKIILTHIDDDSEVFLKEFINSFPNGQKSHYFIAFDGFILDHNN
jgi:hypothetical protein